MTNVWPPSLPPAALVSNNDNTDEGYTVRSAMSVGPPKVRARATLQRTSYTIQLMLTQAQVDTMRGFWRSTCVLGTQPFQFIDQVDGTNLTLRFVGAPKYTNVGIGVWQCDCNLETP